MERDHVSDLLDIYRKRTELLSVVCAGTLDKQAVERRVDSSRPTINRAFRELEETGVLTSTGTTYELTRFGELFCQEFDRTRTALGTLAEVADVLAQFPGGAPIDMRLLEEAEVERAKEHAPQEPFLHVVDVASGADEIRGYSSTVMPSYVDEFYSLIVEAETPATLVLTAEVVETLETNYPEKFTDLKRVDQATVYVTQQVRDHGLLIAEDTVAVPIGGASGRLEAVIVNDTDAALAWGAEYFERLVDSASVDGP